MVERGGQGSELRIDGRKNLDMQMRRIGNLMLYSSMTIASAVSLVSCILWIYTYHVSKSWNVTLNHINPDIEANPNANHVDEITIVSVQDHIYLSWTRYNATAFSDGSRYYDPPKTYLGFGFDFDKVISGSRNESEVFHIGIIIPYWSILGLSALLLVNCFYFKGRANRRRELRGFEVCKS